MLASGSAATDCAGAARVGCASKAPDLKDVSPINHAEQFSIPILLVHGRKDQPGAGEAVARPRGAVWPTELENFLNERNPA